MNFDFNIQKATDAAALFIKKEGGKINLLKLVKLMYILERRSIQSRQIPVFGGEYFSMKHGPVPSKILDLINYNDVWRKVGSRLTAINREWNDYISARDNAHCVELKREREIEHLSASEIKLIEEIYAEHHSKNQWELRNWCHQNCEEWKDVASGSLPIELKDMASAIGLEQSEIEQIEENVAEHIQIRALIA